METVPLRPERLAELEDYARRRGKSTADALDDALADFLDWERQDYQEATAAIRQGRAEMEAGQGRPAHDFLAELRRKHDL